MHTGHNLWKQTILFAMLLVGSGPLAGCGSEKKHSSEDDDAGDTSQPAETDSETASDTVADSASETDSETALDTEDFPPDLPDLCTRDRGQTAASEEDDWSSETKGDGRGPVIVNGSETMMAWHYLSADDDAAWEIQVAPFDPEPDGGLPGPDEGPPGPRVNPADPGPVSMFPDLTPRGNAFGIAWQDGRFDPTCEKETLSKCQRQLALLSVDGQGQALSSPVPIQVTMDANIATGPSIVATEKGYIVIWSERASSASTVMAVAVGENGTLGNPHQISAGNDADNNRKARIAALGSVIVVVWGTSSQSKILGRTLGENAEPIGEIQSIQEDCNCLYPDISAGGSGFVVSWSETNGSDYEIFTRMLDGNGVPVAEAHQATWTTTDIFSSAVASSTGDTFALAWSATKDNGESECLVSTCHTQVLATLLDENGRVMSRPVMLSEDPNPVGQFDLAFDGTGWTAVYELPRLGRKQVFYGRMVCDR